MKKVLPILILLCMQFSVHAQVINPGGTTLVCPGSSPASISYVPVTLECGGTPITFTGTPGPGLVYFWNFGDPNSPNNTDTSYSSNLAIHHFVGNPSLTLMQTATVRLIIENSSACRDTAYTTINFKRIPRANLSGTGQVIFLGQTYFKQCTSSPALFTFTNQSAPVANISNYKIRWGDNTLPDYDSPTPPFNAPHTYNVGNYILEYIVIDAITGCPDTARYGVFVGNTPAGGIGNDNPNLSGCTGATFSFPFSTLCFSNPAGTYYYVTVNDGTPTVIYSQATLPQRFFHTFNSPSCGIGTPPPGVDYFTVSIRIVNPCNITGIPGSIGGIKISQIPQAGFRISPKDTVCINQIITLTDTSKNRYITEAGNCSPGKSLWSISPGIEGVDWSRNSGVFGSGNGSLFPSAWTAGSAILQLRFFNPGTYNVKLKTGGSDSCGIDSVIKSICVNPLPVANFSMTKDTICTSLTDSVIYTPVTPACGNNIFEWSVPSYLAAGGCQPTGSNYIYVDGTNANSPNPHFKFLNAGKYMIKLITYSPARSCSAQLEKTVVVKGVPVVSLTTPTRVCQHQPVILSHTDTCYISTANYYWTFVGSDSLPSTLHNPPPITYSNTGTFNITLDVTNECGTTGAIKPITVDSLITAHAGPDTTICGTCITMSANSPGAGVGIWTKISGPGNPGIVPVNSPTAVICGLMIGTYVFQWKITNGGCKDSSRVTVIVISGPSTANAGPDQALCLVTSTTMAATPPVIGIGTWDTLSGPNLPAVWFSDLHSPTSTVNGLTTGVYRLTWTISFNNCNVSRDTVIITVAANPTPANAGPDQTICTLTATLTGNPPIVGTGRWDFLGGPLFPPPVFPPGMRIVSVNFTQSGTYLFRWTISNTPCSPSTEIVQITVSVIDSNTISGNQAICINTTPATINGSIPVGGNGGYIYQWQESVNGGPWTNIPGGTNINYSPGALTQSTCYRRIVTTAICSGSQGDTSAATCITVNPNARALFAASNTLLCAPVNLDTIITVTPFPTRNLEYKWYRDNMLIIPAPPAGSPPSVLIPTPGQTVVIKLVTTSLYSCLADSMFITFNTRPSVAANFIKDSIAGCGPLSVNFTNTSSILDTSIHFFWDFGNGIRLNDSLQPTSPILFQASPLFRDITYHITLKAFSGCDTTYKFDSVTVFANPKARFTSIPTGCSPFNDTIRNNSFGQDAFTTYFWDFGDGETRTTYDTGFVYKTYNTGVVRIYSIKLKMTNRCKIDSMQTTIIVSPNTIGANITPAGPDLFGCAPHTAYFQNSSTGAAVLYIDYDDGFKDTIPNSQSVFSHNFATSGIYNVSIKLKNACSDTTVTRRITVYDKPIASFTLLKTLLCTGDTLFTNNTSANANSYEWLWGDNSSTGAFNSFHVYPAAATYTVRLVAKRVNIFGIVCTDTSAITITVVQRIPSIVLVNPNSLPCIPYTINVFASNAASATQIAWSFYDSTVAPFIFYATGPTASHTYRSPGVYKIKLVVQNIAGCKDSSISQVTVSEKPGIVFTPFDVKSCNTDTTITFNVTLNYKGTDPVSYAWFINDTFAGSGNPYSHHFSGPPGIPATKIYSIKVVVRNSFGCGATDTVLIGNFTVQTIAARHISVSPSIVQTQPDYTFTFTDSGQALPNSIYTWNPGDRAGQQLPGKTITYTYGDTGTYLVKMRVQDFASGCILRDSVKVYVLYVPGYLYVANAFCPGCARSELRQFLPLGKGLKEYHLIIYTILGQKVFETTSLDGNGSPNEPWDGNWADGKNTKQGAYTWQIKARYLNGGEWKGMLNPKTKQLQKQGFITILR